MNNHNFDNKVTITDMKQVDPDNIARTNEILKPNKQWFEMQTLARVLKSELEQIDNLETPSNLFELFEATNIDTLKSCFAALEQKYYECKQFMTK